MSHFWSAILLRDEQHLMLRRLSLNYVMSCNDVYYYYGSADEKIATKFDVTTVFTDVCNELQQLATILLHVSYRKELAPKSMTVRLLLCVFAKEIVLQR